MKKEIQLLIEVVNIIFGRNNISSAFVSVIMSISTIVVAKNVKLLMFLNLLSQDLFMEFLRVIRKSLIRFALKLKAQKTISRLRQDSDIDQKMLGDTLKEALENYLSLEEKEWIDRVRLLKMKLESSTEKLLLTDYGARQIHDPKVYDQEIKYGRTITTTVGEKCKTGSELYFWVLILFKLIRKFKPVSCLELGTCMGMSASIQASALNLNGNGRMVTLEGAEPLASIAKMNFQTLGLNNVDVVVGRFQDTLNDVLKKYGPVDYAFLDGHLDGLATKDYLEEIIPFCKNKAIIIIDNISWSDSMKKAWKTIEADERIKITLNLRQMGICIIDNKRVQKQSYRIPLYGA
jgi:predicted O-methyltransferase YrrM